MVNDDGEMMAKLFLVVNFYGKFMVDDGESGVK